MKIAITAQGDEASSPVDPHFGRAPYFLLIDMATGEQTAVDNDAGAAAAQGAGLQAAQRLVDLQVQAVVTGQVGPKAWSALQAAGIAVYGIQGGTAGEAVQAFLDGKLSVLVTPSRSSH